MSNNRTIYISANILDDSEKLNQVIKPSIEDTEIVVRHNFELIDNEFVYRLEINPKLIEQYHEEIVLKNGKDQISSELVPRLPMSFTERLFYNLPSLKI